MPYEEKRTWILGVASVVSYVIYLVVVLVRARDQALTSVSFAAPLLWAVGGSILASIIGSIAVAIGSREGDRKDQRDKEIDLRGAQIGGAFTALGAGGGLLLSLADADRFWIANAIYLGLTLGALVSAAAKLVAYRRGMWPW
ncbi:hypothetical protein GPX89_24580 [Nocardia sp. ET3-3]|uniref:Uncharacterized protein n=1 Tax=Nocardia terrae TaxID=2675851 RepID=A0A7K1V191_9NOCA|nr:hypothetical protein [Nocardia terrae]MVU80413.1 hypothetical protein [Nocardia terrae]